MTFIKYLWITEPKRIVVHHALSRLEKISMLELNMLRKNQKTTFEKREVSSDGYSKKKDFEEKVKRLEEKLGAEQKKNEEYLNRLKYLQADFENFRKRVEKEVQDIIQRSNERLVVSLIEIMDDLESAISVAEKTANKDATMYTSHFCRKRSEQL